MFKTKEGIYNFVYSMGAAVVIIGALFKLTGVYLEFLEILCLQLVLLPKL